MFILSIAKKRLKLTWLKTIGHMELILTEIDQMYGISIKKTGLQHLNGLLHSVMHAWIEIIQQFTTSSKKST